MKPHEHPVIDNERVILSEVLRSSLPHARRASIAVGYFFISGFAEIMNHLGRIEASKDPDDIIRLLISPTTNKRTAEALLAANEEISAVHKTSSAPRQPKETLKEASAEVRRTLEHMPQRDADQDAVRKLIEMIRNGKLHVKVYTKTQLHAKAYIFELGGDSILPSMSIVGSSNLSISGIRDHAELNLRTNDPLHSKELLEWFDRHWVDEDCCEFTKEMARILSNSWAARDTTPADVYGKAVLHEHKSLFDESAFADDDVERGYELLPFQKKAVGDALKKLDDYGGVIIADVVGMGKTYMGTAIMRYLRKTEESQSLVICPPHLEDMWKDFMRDNRVYGDTVSRYKIGMNEGVLERYKHCNVILIDESHNFRNYNTNSYKALLGFMDGKIDNTKVIMLSATPISNGVMDLKNQLRLFPQESLHKIPQLAETNLDAYFKGTEDENGITDDGKEKIQDLLRNILIRRTRTQIKDKYAGYDKKRKVWYMMNADGERQYLPNRKLRNPEAYDAEKVYDYSYEAILENIEKLKLARYRPGEYLVEEYKHKRQYDELANTSKPLVGIVRTLLLKRMESSIKAFYTSIDHYIRGYEKFRKILKEGTVPIGREFVDEIYKSFEYDDDDEFASNLAQIQSKYDIRAFNVRKWINELTHDINIFESIRGLLDDPAEFEKRDDKLHKLCHLIRQYRNDEKILIFTESAVTARYISKYITSKFSKRSVGQLDSKSGSKAKSLCVRRFDPKHNASSDKILESDELDILVSTDVLSEGVNLHISRVVINYDFHWNPVRLIQRVGRIDRIGTEHPAIHIFNFLPTTKIDRALSLREIVEKKIDTIRKILGHDQPILTSMEMIDTESTMAIYNPDSSDDILDVNLGVLDIDETESEKHADRIKKNNKEGYYRNMQFGIRGVSGHGRLLVACEAEEDTIRDGSTISTKPFRKYYEVTGGGGEGGSPVSRAHTLGRVGGSPKTSAPGYQFHTIRH